MKRSYFMERYLVRCLTAAILSVYAFPQCSSAQTVEELWKLTEDDWLRMSTQERLDALNVSNNHAGNQTFVGRFGRYYNMYRRWGYDYYEMEDRYENLAFRGFENYNIVEDRRQRWYYNQFGDRLTKMTSNAQIWYERISDDGSSSASGPSGYINAMTPQRGGTYGIDGIWVARESTDDWAISVIGAGSLRTILTPLTLSMPNMEGMKIDFQSANNQATYVSSTLTGVQNYVMLLRGGQFRRKFGVLNVGVSYANMYGAEQSREKGNHLQGTVMDYTPTPIYFALRILDDSPQDGDGPIIQGISLRINGRERPDIRPLVLLDDLSRDKVSAVNSKSQQDYYEPGSTTAAAPFEHMTVFEQLPKYLDYLYMNDYVRGWNTKILTENFNIEAGKKYYRVIDPDGAPLQVNGNEYVVYLFDLGSITEKVDRVQAVVTVANDYRIQVSQIYTKNTEGGHDSKGENMSFYKAEYWRTAAQADGNVKDGSNLRTIAVDFGYEVGNSIYGFDAQFNYLGFKVRGEYVTNYHRYMFSDGVPGTGFPPYDPTDLNPRMGHHSSQKDNAYYLTVQKESMRYGFSGEIFKMGKFYRPYMNTFMTTELSGTGLNCRNDVIRMSLIEDNDDSDQYPDQTYRTRVMGVSMQTLVDPDGVFPGNDLDHDSYPDNEKNFNGIPDYDEPFLMFNIDPDEFVFGDDFNNNTIPDFREDDLKYDTPYDLDRRGHHLRFRVSPQSSMNVTLGTLRTRGIGQDTRSDDDYIKVDFNYNVFMIGNVFAEYRYHEIQDNVQDSFVVYSTEPSYLRGLSTMLNRHEPGFYYDEREYRNSRVNKFFLESRIKAIPSITLENHVKYEHNQQVEGILYDNTYQPEDVVSIFAMVSKIAYTKKWGNLTFTPGIKFRLYKKDRSESLNPLEHYLLHIPLVMFQYDVSRQTRVSLGLQGFRGYEMLYRDYIQPHNNYKKVNYILQIENRTDYFGFDIWGGFGFKLEEISFERAYRKFEEYKMSSFFAQFWCGY